MDYCKVNKITLTPLYEVGFQLRFYRYVILASGSQHSALCIARDLNRCCNRSSCWCIEFEDFALVGSDTPQNREHLGRNNTTCRSTIHGYGCSST